MTEREKRIGMTFTQLLSLVGVVGLILAAWISMNVQVADLTARVNTLERDRMENRQEHQLMIEKLDKLIYEMKVK
jgi:hypothetical protein